MALAPDVSFWQTAQAIINALGGVPTVTNLKLLAAWSYCEKPHDAGGSWQWNNPLNTTETCCGWTGNANSVGVKIYPTPAEGILATVKTLQNGDYPMLVQALLTSNASRFFSATGEMATWGTDMACIRSVYGALANPPSVFLLALNTSTVSPSTLTGPSWVYVVLGGLGVVLGGAALWLAVSPQEWEEFVQWEHQEVRTQTRTIHRRR